MTNNTPWGYYRHMREDIKHKVIRRLKIVEGQMRGLQGMVASEEYCIDIITQASAIKEALSGIEGLILENHLSTHVINQMKQGENKKMVSEILKVYKLNRKK